MAIQKLTWSGNNGDAAAIGNTGYTGLLITDGGGSMVFDTGWMPRGKLSLRSTGTTAPGYVFGGLDFAATDLLAFEQPVRPLVLPTATAGEEALFYFGDGESRRVSLNITAAGALRLRDGGNLNAWTSAAGVMAVGVGVIIAIWISRHATAGALRVVVYNEDGTVRAQTPATDGGSSGKITARNTGSTSINRTRSSMAKGSSSSVIAATYQFGEPRFDRAATDIMPAPTAFNPFRMWIGGVMTPVKVQRYVPGSGYEPVVSS